MEHDQRVIIKFLWNEAADASQIAARLQAQFAEHIYQFKQSNSVLQRYGAAVKTCMMQFAAEDLLWIILMAKFWLSQRQISV
jgi:hypothetical protein